MPDVERRRNPGDMVTRADFDNFKNRVEPTLNRIEKALFAQDSNNEFESRGVMTVMRKLDTHIDFVCTIWRWFWRTALAVIPCACAVIGLAGQAKGWW